VIREAREASRNGFRVTMLVPQSDDHKQGFQLDGIEIETLPIMQERGRTTLRSQLRFMGYIRRWVRGQKRRPDVIHVHNMPDYLYWAVRRWHRQGSRVVLDVHDIMSTLALHRYSGAKRYLASLLLGILERSVWRQVDHLITVHDAYRDVIVSAGIKAENVSVVLNTPDPEVCSSIMRHKESSSAFKIVFHGTVSSRMGVVYAVRALPLVIKEVPNAEMTILGGGGNVEEVHATIRDLNLQTRVTFVDHFLPMEEVVGCIRDANAAVVPYELSDFTKQILPVKILEYAALGIPVVSTRLPLVEYYLGDCAVHFIPEPEPREIAHALIRLAQDEQYRTKLVAAGQEFTASHSWRSYSPVLIDALSAGLDRTT
jgi:glycosyltransferase involved in cell wall biosynthesis